MHMHVMRNGTDFVKCKASTLGCSISLALSLSLAFAKCSCALPNMNEWAARRGKKDEPRMRENAEAMGLSIIFAVSLEICKIYLAQCVGVPHIKKIGANRCTHCNTFDFKNEECNTSGIMRRNSVERTEAKWKPEHEKLHGINFVIW